MNFMMLLWTIIPRTIESTIMAIMMTIVITQHPISHGTVQLTNMIGILQIWKVGIGIRWKSAVMVELRVHVRRRREVWSIVWMMIVLLSWWWRLMVLIHNGSLFGFLIVTTASAGAPFESWCTGIKVMKRWIRTIHSDLKIFKFSHKQTKHTTNQCYPTSQPARQSNYSSSRHLNPYTSSSDYSPTEPTIYSPSTATAHWHAHDDA